RCNGFVGDRGDAIEKEIGPTFPVAFQTHKVEAPVILFAMAFKEKAEIEKRLLQYAPVLQQQGDHQAPDPPVAIKIGVNGFELSMQKSSPHEFRQPVLGMNVFLECAEELWKLVGGRGNVDCVPRAAPANPVLAAADFSRLLACSAPTAHQPLVGFVQEPQRDWQTALRPELGSRVGEGVEVVRDLLDICVG